MSFSKLARDAMDPRGRHGCSLAQACTSRAPGISLPAWGWESSATLLAYVHKLVNAIQLPVSFLHERICQHHMVVITFVLRNKQTNICIEFKELQGGVRATSLLCLLGIGLGLGSVLLYKLCSRVLSPAISAVRGKKRPTSPGRGQFLPQTHHQILSPETPDSGISTGTTLTQAVSSKVQSPEEPVDEDTTFSLRFRNSGGSHDYERLDHMGRPNVLLHSQDLRRSGTYMSSAVSDQGFVSGCDRLSRYYSDQESIGAHSFPGEARRRGMVSRQNLSHSTGEVQNNLDHTNQSFSPILRTNNRLPLVDESQTNYASFSGAYHSTPQSQQRAGVSGDQLMLRRNDHSHASNLSASTGYSIRDSVYSGDFTDRSSFMQTPNELFEPDESNTSNMEQLHQEIRMIREEISEMNDRVQVLSSREDMEELFMLTPNPMKDVDFGPPLRVRRPRRPQTRERHHSGGSRSCSVSVDGEVNDVAMNRRSYHHQGEFMWDYQSDLATEDSQNFVVERPLVGESAADLGDTIDYDSPTFDHVRKYIESCCNANITAENTSGVANKSSAPKSRTFNSITDMYIDDSLSELGGFTIDGTNEPRNIPDGCYSTVATSSELYDNDSVTKQLSFSQDCDNNGNRGDGLIATGNHGKTCTIDPDHMTCMEHSICLQCGSPSHRRRCREVVSAKSNSNSSRESGVSDGGRSGGPRSDNSHSLRGSQDSCPNCGHNVILDGDVQATLQRNKRRKWQVMNICRKVNIFEYVEKQFKDDSTGAQIMKKGYHQIPRLLGKSQIRPIRGDNYCVLRAVLYQICVNNYDIMRHIGSLTDTLKRLSMFDDPQYAFLKSWSFANRLPYDTDCVMDRIHDCIETFYSQVAQLSQLPTSAAREMALLERLNFDPEIDLKILEAMKVLMMLEAIEMYETFSGHGQIQLNKPPVFVWLMYSRQSSQSPQALFTNHINTLGDIHPAQQVELFLLGYTLGVKIEIVRPPRYGHDDFISHYPDDGADGFPTVYLVAEDDRHYHAIMA